MKRTTAYFRAFHQGRNARNSWHKLLSDNPYIHPSACGPVEMDGQTFHTKPKLHEGWRAGWLKAQEEAQASRPIVGAMR